MHDSRTEIFWGDGSGCRVNANGAFCCGALRVATGEELNPNKSASAAVDFDRCDTTGFEFSYRKPFLLFDGGVRPDIFRVVCSSSPARPRNRNI